MRLRVLLGIIAFLALLPSVAQGQSPPSVPTPQDYPGVRGKGNNKLDSFLNDVSLRARSQDAASVARTAPTSRSASVGVRIRLQPGTSGFPARLASLGGVAANIIGDEIEAYVPVTQLEGLTALQGVSSVRTLIPPQPDLSTSQGAALHNTPNWNAFGFTGAGIKVGVIDVGFFNYTSRQAEGEVPAPTAYRCYSGVGTYSTSNFASCDTSTVHGVAVSETIIDEAPDAMLYIANPFSQADLLATVQWMASQGVQVINHSVSWTWDGPGDGTSPYATSPLKSIEAAEAAGIVWVNSAGNAAQQVWTGPWADATSNGFIDYTAGVEDEYITLSAGQQVVLQLRWSDTWGAATRDLDLLLYRDTNGALVAASTLNQSSGAAKDPFEFIVYTATNAGLYRIRIGQAGGTDPAQVQLNVFNQASSLSTQTPGHAVANPAESASPAMLAVGAANWSTPTSIASYSSQGPTADNRIKPDITGADCGNTVSYGFSAFCGTSQASPHVAGLAALILQRSPNLSAAQVAAQLKSWAIDRGAPGADNTWGAGFAELQNIDGALAFTQQPSGGFAGVTLATQPTVEIQDSGGVTDAADDSTQVTLSVSGSGSPTISCSGGETKTVVAGVAAFSGCSVSPPGTGYTLIATPDCGCLTATSSTFAIAEGPTKLAFTMQPSNGITDTDLATQPVVAVRNSSDATITADKATQVTLSSVPAGIACSGGLTLTVTNGVASFSGCQFSSAGDYTLHAASSPVLTPADSNGLTITGPPAKLAFVAQPANAGVGAPLGTQPNVAVLDANDDVVVADQSSVVTLTLNAPSSGGPGILSCTNGPTRVVSNGIATFAGCAVDAAGVGYSIDVSSGALSSDSSSAFSIFGSATELAFAQEPAAGTSGQAFPVQPVVVIRDALGTTVGTSTSTVTLSLVAGGGPGVLSCSGGLSKAAVAGVATFAGCSLSAAGTYEVHAAASGLAAVDTAAFGVTGVGPAAKLAFDQEPDSGVGGQAFPTQPIVSIRDAANSLVADDSATSVTLSVVSGPGVLTCDGGLSATASSGLATFSGCKLSQPGDYVLQAAASGLASGTTGLFTVDPPPPVSTWYFAEGFTGNSWETYLYILNATSNDANVTVTYFRESGGPVVKSIVIPAESSRTLFANDPADGPGPDQAFGVTITSDQVITAQQSLIDTAGNLAHGSVGSKVLSQTWYFAEGYTGNGWLTFISATNPGNVPANVSLTYHLTDGTSVVRNATVPAQSRFTFAGHDDPVPPESTGVGTEKAFAVSINSDQPIVAQEVLIDTVGLLAHGTIGVTSLQQTWYFAEGYTGDFWLTFISIGNLSASTAHVTATYNILGQPPVTKSLTIAPGARDTFAGHDPSSGPGPEQSFGVTITSDVPIVAQEVLIDPKPGVALAHAVMGSPSLATSFSFGGGSSEANWITFVSATNPGSTAVSVTATYYFEGGLPPVVHTVPLAANSRTTFASFDVDTGVPAGLKYGVVISATGPIISQEVSIDVSRFLAYSAAGTPGP